jgi:exonuclease SbcC
MRPLKLTLEGFTSFRVRQTLDFANLDLFAITGPTGAGKSSLLDAITFALYGKVARESRTAELVSQGATNLKVEFHFSVQQTEYRVTRTWRHRDSSPDIKFLLDRRRNGEWERCDRTQKVEDILRMDFDTFTRVILLPQGQFDEFLKGSATKRRELLRQLSGLEIFEQMREEASNRTKHYKGEREAVERLLADIQAPTATEVKAAQVQLARLELEIPRLTEVAANAQKLLDDEERLLEQIQRLSQLQQDLAKLDTQANAIASLKQQLQQAQVASRLQGDWVLVQEARSSAADAESAVKAAAEHLAKVQAELTIQQQQHGLIKIQQAQVKTQLEARERDLVSAKAYEEQYQQQAQEVARALETLKLKDQQLSSAKRELKAAEKKVAAARKQLAAAKDSLAQSSPGGSRLEVLIQVVPLLLQWQAIAKTAQAARKKWEKAVKDRKKAEGDRTSAASQLKQAETVFQEAGAALKAAELTNAIAAEHNHATALRASLHTGDTCLVCGGVYPEAHHLPALRESAVVDITLLQESVAAAEPSYRQANTALIKAEATLESLKLKELECQQDWESNDAELVQCHAQISAIIAQEEWEAAALAQEHSSLVASNAKHQEALVEQEKAVAELNKLEQTLKFAQKTHAAVLEELQTAAQEVEHRQRNLQEIQTKLHQLTNGNPYETLRQALERDKQDWERQLQAAEESYQAARRSAIQAEEADKQALRAVEFTRAKREHLEVQWTASLQVAGFTESRFQEAQASADKQDSWQSAITHHQHKKVELSTLVKEVTSLIGGRTTDERVLVQRSQAKRSADEQVHQANSSRGSLLTWLQGAAAMQQRAERLLTQQSKLMEEEQIYHTLSQNLKSNEFQSYILEHLEAELVARATVLLQELTDSRYSLKIQDGEYWVEDNWNGGETRRVRTLSGGETFATSLSMALALSEKLSMGVELGSLFLDEGFGTLDADTLESVTQILESLRQQDRLIGVITHVRGLGERLPTQVKVHKSPEGSRLLVEAL